MEGSPELLNIDSSGFSEQMAWLFFFVLGFLFVILAQLWYHGFPIWDDYHAIVEFLVNVVSASGPLEHIVALTRWHNEHPVVVPNLLFALANGLPGPVSFRLILLLGHLFLGVVAFILARRGTEKGMTYWPVVVAVVLFSLNHYRLVNWPMGAVTNYLVIALGIGVTQLAVSDQRRDRVFSILLGVGALLTTGGGAFFLRSRWRQERSRFDRNYQGPGSCLR
jgi:hypothetical protein